MWQTKTPTYCQCSIPLPATVLSMEAQKLKKNRCLNCLMFVDQNASFQRPLYAGLVDITTKNMH